MRNKFYYIVLIAMAVLSTSCKKMLDEQALDFVSPEQFFKSEAQCIAALNGCYNPLTSIFNQGLMLANEGITDLAFLGNQNNETRFELSPSNPGMGKGLWTSSYQGVMYCNSAIDGITKSPIAEDKKPALIAEAVALRALYYYVLTSTFGDVPFYKDHVANLVTMEKVNALGRMSASDTRKELITELQKYAPDLPNLKTSDVPGNRISSSMAYMLIAKMAMWEKEYQTALTALEEIRTIYGSLAQYSLEDTYFRNKNTPESIFEVQFSWSATGLKKVTSVACYFTPSRTANTSTYNGINIPELGSKANPFTSVTPSAYYMSLYDVWDPRRNIILAYSYNGQSFARPLSANGTGKPWMGPKFWCPGMDNLSDGNNQKVFRYADALLMIAECANELGQSSVALDAINQVKRRASVGASTPINLELPAYPGKAEFFEEVKAERAREVMGEYGRKWDLVRWGIWYDSIINTVANEFIDIKQNVRPYHQYYPIPDNEILRSDGKLHNNTYK
ncbi:RagB/SusD family nutrient uptake outer membrane protein [Pedobacter frigoris]|uniref:RagB/SusD family nutrient uptake outer membrane protein n=1 Tax=Pedobacter frigoris TaxID=2571272 RepID=A0A4U1CH24_9SPHI|nr:RagB/SusD family nutrient uptake outer membrane protein [Pedobacter frigoris]TKC06065.1 RagB/SusD family nutrient uptake outer membrane protein [Pedobacter frigoris]